MFEVNTYKKRFDANKIVIFQIGNGRPYIVRTSINNGLRGYINEDEAYLNEGNTISFGQDTATMFYQEQPYFTGDKIKIMKSKYERFSKKNAQFFISAMTKSFSDFSWGSSSFNVDIIESQKVYLPTKDDEIDFDFMEQFIAQLEHERLQKLDTYLSATGLDNYQLTEAEQKALTDFENGSVEWNEFKIGKLFKRIATKKLPFKADELLKEPKGGYNLACLTSSFRNQGLNYFAPRDNATILKNVISIPSNSDVYRAYFQSMEFTVLSDAYAIDWDFDDVQLQSSHYLFAVQCINKVTDLPIYSYKNKLGGWNVVKNKSIQLPTQNNEPDYDYMKNLISAIQKQVIQGVVEYSEAKQAQEIA